MTDDLFDIDDFATADTAEMVVAHPITGEPTSWRITFAGPGHPKTVKQTDRLARQTMRESRDQEMARVNGRKWKGEERTPDENRRRNAEFFAERMLGWTPVRINGADLPFSEETAVKLLMDPKYLKFYQQVLNFLADERSFTKASASG
jgi:hypothetical protein